MVNQFIWMVIESDMSRLSPIVEKLAARQKARKQDEAALNKFIDGMLVIIKDELTDNGCGIRVMNKSFVDEGRVLYVMLILNFPANTYETPLSYMLKIEKRGEVYHLSSGNNIHNDPITTPEEATDVFFKILYNIA